MPCGKESNFLYQRASFFKALKYFIPWWSIVHHLNFVIVCNLLPLHLQNVQTQRASKCYFCDDEDGWQKCGFINQLEKVRKEFSNMFYYQIFNQIKFLEASDGKAHKHIAWKVLRLLPCYRYESLNIIFLGCDSLIR